MARPIDADAVKFSISGLRYIDPNDYFALAEYFMKQVKAMPTLTPPNKWVSVEERLPEKKQDVLMFFKSGNMAVGWWHDLDEHITFWCAYTDDGFYTDCDDMPTHWMPLPTPPDRRPPGGEEDT